MTDVSEIDGVGNTAKSQLNEMGIHTVNELANTPVEELDEAGIRMAEKIHDRAQRQGIVIKDGSTIEHEETNARYVSTGIRDIDAMMGGGFKGGSVIGVAGEPKVGKTQFIFQAVASAVDFSDGHAIYIETEPDRFSIKRIKDLSQKDDSYKRVHCIQAHDSDSDIDNLKIQMNAYKAVRENFDDVCMVAVDSFVANFRLSGNYNGRETLPGRSGDVSEHLSEIQGVANEFDCPVLMALQVMGDPDPYSGGRDVSIWGPVVMDHTLSYLMYLSHGKGELKEIEMIGNSSHPDDSVMVKVPEDSPIESVE